MSISSFDIEFRKECENIAITMRHTLGLHGYLPLSGINLANSLNVTINTPAQLSNLSEATVQQIVQSLKWSAITVLIEPPLIIVHPLHAPTRFESDVMHELSHLLLNHKPEKLGLLSARFVTREYTKRQEREAEYLGGCLQIPAIGLDHARQKGWNKAQTARYFVASEQMVQFRLNMTGRTL